MLEPDPDGAVSDLGHLDHVDVYARRRDLLQLFDADSSQCLLAGPRDSLSEIVELVEHDARSPYLVSFTFGQRT
jgi:hypothetical protein